MESPIQSSMRSHTSQFLTLEILHFGTMSSTPSMDFWPSRIQQGWVTYQEKPNCLHGTQISCWSPIYTHIHIREQDSSKHKNINSELNRIIMSHVHWAKEEESVFTWLFPMRGKWEEVDLYPCLGSLSGETGISLEGDCKGRIWEQKIWAFLCWYVNPLVMFQSFKIIAHTQHSPNVSFYSPCLESWNTLPLTL